MSSTHSTGSTSLTTMANSRDVMRLWGSDVELEPLERITARDVRALDEDAADVARYVA
jgi:hypothetical protein